MPTIEQIKAARALIGWNQKDLAEQAGLSQTGIARIENGTHQPNSQTVDKIVRAFERAQIEFIGERGVKKKKTEIKTLSGTSGYLAFFDDVYETIKEKGGNIVISGVEEDSFSKYFPDNGDMHRNRMAKLNNYTMQCLICEGDYNFVSSNYCEYRWTPKEAFEAVPFYIYGDKVAFMDFENDEVDIYIMAHKKIVSSFRKRFALQWENAKIPAEKK